MGYQSIIKDKKCSLETRNICKIRSLTIKDIKYPIRTLNWLRMRVVMADASTQWIGDVTQWRGDVTTHDEHTKTER